MLALPGSEISNNMIRRNDQYQPELNVDTACGPKLLNFFRLPLPVQSFRDFVPYQALVSGFEKKNSSKPSTT